MKHVFVMDPMSTVHIDKDSTFALMWEAQRRGHEVWFATVDGLFVERGRAFASAQPAQLQKVHDAPALLGDTADVDLGTADVVWMRKDPPFHIDYIFNTYVLDLAVHAGALVVNHPDGLRAMNEKAWAMKLPGLVPESLITQDMARLRAFVEELGAAVVKPLDGNGGEGVFVVRADDPNIGVILEMSTRHGQRKVLSQRYLPEAKQGDKRIILVEGEPVGAMLRVPSGVDHRGNMHAGATVERCELTARDLEICAAIGPALRDAGQVFVGIDVIGDWLTEVNVTSPTGIHEIRRFEGVDLAALVVDAVEARRAACRG